MTHGGGFVGGQVVHDDDVAWGQRRRQHLFDIGQEGGAVHGSVEHHGGGHALEPERADEGGGLPMSMGYRSPATLAPWRPAITPRHLGRGTRLVDEYQPLRLQIRLSLEPGPAATQDVSPLLLAGVRGFF